MFSFSDNEVGELCLCRLEASARCGGGKLLEAGAGAGKNATDAGKSIGEGVIKGVENVGKGITEGLTDLLKKKEKED